MSSPASALSNFRSLNARAEQDDQKREEATPEGGVMPCPYAKRRIRIRIVVRDFYFSLVKNKRYELTVEGEGFAGNTGDTGLVDHLVKRGAKTGELKVWFEGAEPCVWELTIDDIDPLALDTGAETRLRNLGIAWSAEGTEETETEAELDTFRGAFRLPDGDAEIDAKTREQLESAYSTQPIETVRKHYFVFESRQ